MPWKISLKNMRDLLTQYVIKHNLKSLVLGVSGGIDSAVVAAIAQPVCSNLNIKFIGRSLPCSTNKSQEKYRAEDIGRIFCTDFEVFSIEDSINFLEGNCEIGYSLHENEVFNKIAKGNLMARTRKCFLYDLAYRTKGMVLSTDNKTEYLLGFWTLGGDVGDYGLIQNLWKTEVYDLARWIYNNEPSSSCNKIYRSLLDCIKAVPTDGLGITNSDLDQLGVETYLEVDNLLKTWLVIDKDSFLYDDELKYPGRLENWEEFWKYRLSIQENPIIQRHLKTEFKRKVPINLERRDIFHS